MNVLQSDLIQFIPALPAERQTTLDGINMPDGIKVFMEFSERFYPDILNMGSLGNFVNDSNGERIYYDAAFRKDSDKNILALFSVGADSTQYSSLDTDDDVIAKILGELDEVYGGKASATYLNHIVQNWSKEPYIQGSYAHHDWEKYPEIVAMFKQPIDDKIYFAGEAWADDWATVHGAAQSAYVAVEKVLAG